MIRISKSRIERASDRWTMLSHIIDESQNIDTDIYYSVPNEYENYLTYELADSFVVGMLLPAVLYNEDIVVEGAMSERLYYNISNSVLYILSYVYGNKIQIHPTQLVNTEFKASGVGCGCSLGVDSFAAMLMHLHQFDAASASYQISHLTYFNMGAMGYVDLEKAKQSYNKDLKMVQSFASEVGLPVVCLESNFSIMYKDFDFDASGDLRNFSAALALQKLFGKYLYGSSFPIADFKFDKGQTGYYESLLAPLLSTESTEIVIANPDMNRIDKTKYILDDPLVKKYLYVCWKELIANRWPDSEVAKVKDQHQNCSRCDKCKRTLLAIDLLGKLDEYEAIFDIPYWKTVKDSYIAKVITYKNDNTFYSDLCNLMHEVGYEPTQAVKKELRRIAIRKSVSYRAVSKIKRILTRH